MTGRLPALARLRAALAASHEHTLWTAIETVCGDRSEAQTLVNRLSALHPSAVDLQGADAVALLDQIDPPATVPVPPPLAIDAQIARGYIVGARVAVERAVALLAGLPGPVGESQTVAEALTAIERDLNAYLEAAS